METNIRAAAEAARKAEVAALAGDEAINFVTRMLHKLVNHALDLSKAAREVAEAATEAAANAKLAAEMPRKTSLSASERAEDVDKDARYAAEEVGKKAENMADRMLKSHQGTVAEVKALSSRVDKAFDLAREAVDRIKAISQRLISNWEMTLTILAVVVATAMLDFGTTVMLIPK